MVYFKRNVDIQDNFDVPNNGISGRTMILPLQGRNQQFNQYNSIYQYYLEKPPTASKYYNIHVILKRMLVQNSRPPIGKMVTL